MKTLLLLLLPLLTTTSSATTTFEVHVRETSAGEHKIAVTYHTADGQRGARTAAAPFTMKVTGRTLDLTATRESGKGEFVVEVAGGGFKGSGTASCEVRINADRSQILVRTDARKCDARRRSE